MKLTSKKKKGFSLIEIIIAVVIFLFIIVWAIDIFRNMNLEKKIALEKARINENISVFEKTLKDYISSANLDLGDNLDVLNSENLNEVRPYFLPTCIISPSIYETSSQRMIIYYNNSHNNNHVDLVRVSANNNRINFSGFTGQANQGIVRFRCKRINIGNNNTFFWYFELSSNFNFNILREIDFGRPILYPTSNYQITLNFRRQVIAQGGQEIPLAYRDIIFQTHGNIRDANLPGGVGNIITNPNLIYAEIRITIPYPRNPRRNFSYSKVLNFYIKHRSII